MNRFDIAAHEVKRRLQRIDNNYLLEPVDEEQEEIVELLRRIEHDD